MIMAVYETKTLGATRNKTTNMIMAVHGRKHWELPEKRP
jgi:hypothetical protein